MDTTRTSNKNQKKRKDIRSNIETLKRQLNLTNSKTSTKIVLRVLRCSGKNVTRSKLMISRFIAEMKENEEYTPKSSKIIMNLNKEINNRSNNSNRKQMEDPHGDDEINIPTIPSSIVYLKRKHNNIDAT